MRTVILALKDDGRRGKSQMNLNWWKSGSQGLVPRNFIKYLTCLHGLGLQFDHFPPTAVWTTGDRRKPSSTFVVYSSSRVNFIHFLWPLIYHGLQ